MTSSHMSRMRFLGRGQQGTHSWPTLRPGHARTRYVVQRPQARDHRYVVKARQPLRRPWFLILHVRARGQGLDGRGYTCDGRQAWRCTTGAGPRRRGGPKHHRRSRSQLSLRKSRCSRTTATPGRVDLSVALTDAQLVSAKKEAPSGRSIGGDGSIAGGHESDHEIDGDDGDDDCQTGAASCLCQRAGGARGG